MPSITEIHEDVFQFLDQKHTENPDIQFTVRGRNAAQRLEQGYWFHGNEQSLYFSLWTGSDLVSKSSNIFIEVAADGQTRLCLSSMDNPELAQVLNVLATALDMKRQVLQGKPQQFWSKTYPEQTDEKPYLAALAQFFSSDFPKIDSLLEVLQAAMREDLRIRRWRSEPDYEQAVAHINALRQTPQTARISGSASRAIILQSLHLKNIGHFADTRMDFFFEKKLGIAAIVGENGTGKTTLLRALALGLLGVENLDTQRIASLARYDSLTEQADRAEITLDYKMGQICRNTVLFTRSGKLDETGSKILEIRNDDRADFVSVLDGQIFNDVLVIGLSQTVSNENKIPFTDRELRPNLSDVANLIFSEPEPRVGFIGDWASATVETNPRLVTRLFNRINMMVQEVTGEPFTLSLQHGKLTYAIGGQQLQAGLMSQGYTNLVGWIGKLAIRFAEVNPGAHDPFQYPAIILIDEIDTYLHPKWQRKILPALAARMTRSYFIVTTHSPYVLQEIPPKKVPLMVFQVRKQGNAVAVKRLAEPTLYGFDLNWISQDGDIFDTDPRPEQDLYEAIRSHIAAGTAGSLAEAEAGISQLRQHGVPEQEPELLRLQQALKARRILLAQKTSV